jgi:CRP/FNR family transcriptional activator FtrB
MRPGIETLRGVHIFAALSAEQLHVLNELGDLARLGPNHDILMEGHMPSDLTFLMAGAVVATQANGDHGDVLTDVIQPPSVIAYPETILGLPSRFGIRAISSVTLVIVPTAPLRTLIEQDAEVARRFLNHALHDLHRLQMETCELKRHSATQRLARYLLELANGTDSTPARFVLPLEKRYIAAKIGCTQENLSRAFASLRRLGVETQRGVVVIRDIAVLRSCAGVI